MGVCFSTFLNCTRGAVVWINNFVQFEAYIVKLAICPLNSAGKLWRKKTELSSLSRSNICVVQQQSVATLITISCSYWNIALDSLLTPYLRGIYELWTVRVFFHQDVQQSITFSCKKVAHTRLPSEGFRSWSRFLAVSLQVTWVINPTVGCHYFPPGLQLPPQPLRELLPISLLGEQRHNGCEQFA